MDQVFRIVCQTLHFFHFVLLLQTGGTPFRHSFNQYNLP